MQKKIFFILIMVLSLVSVSAQPINKVKLDSLMNALAENGKAMGSLVISKNGSALYSKAIGFSSVSGKEKIPATVKTKYRIGSISKMFTATIIFQLVEEGKVSLSTTLENYFPQLPNAKTITVGILLSHRSGLHNFTDDATYKEWETLPKTHDEILAIIAKGKADFDPGTNASYSNSNFVVLGYLIEKICGKPYKDVLQERIISKVGLADTYYGDKINAKNNESYSFQKDHGEWKQERETDMSIPGGAGAIVSTPADLAKFIEALFAYKLINESSLNMMKTISDGYGMGMFQFPFGKKKAFGHTGGIDAFESMLTYFPDDSVAVAYCSNGTVYPMNDIMIGVLSIYFNQPYSIPSFKTFALNANDLDKYTGVYSSSEMPLKITIAKDNGNLTAQATGQSSFQLEATGKDSFKFDPAGLAMDFYPEKKEMKLKQGGGNFLFTKDK